MTADDLPQIAEIDRRCYPYPWTQGNFSDSLYAGHRCCVCVHGEDIVGYAVLMAVLDEVHLLNLTVSQPYQGMGHGRRILAQLIASSKREASVSMWLEVRPSNVVARRLYCSAGFVEVGLRKQYYPAEQGREDALIMCLEL